MVCALAINLAFLEEVLHKQLQKLLAATLATFLNVLYTLPLLHFKLSACVSCLRLFTSGEAKAVAKAGEAKAGEAKAVAKALDAGRGNLLHKFPIDLDFVI